MSPDEIKSNLAFIGEYCDYDFDDTDFDGVISEALQYIAQLEQKVNRLEDVVNTKNIRISELIETCESIKSTTVIRFVDMLKQRNGQSTMDSRICTIEMVDNIAKSMLLE